MKRKVIPYSEGQWFLVPLRTEGYALGTVVRGNHKTKVPLGYFFGQKYHEIPGSEVTFNMNHKDAIFIAWFGDLRIIDGSWPLLGSTRPFSRSEWPIPKFGRRIPYPPDKGLIVEYGEFLDGRWQCVREILVNETEMTNLPNDGIWGAGVIEQELTRLLDKNQ